MGGCTSKGVLLQSHPHQQHQQQQYRQGDLVVRVLLSTDPSSPYAKDLLRLLHGVCRGGRAAALSTISWVSLDYCERARPYHRQLYLLAAADRAGCLFIRSDQVRGLLRALTRQQQQQQQRRQLPPGRGVRQRLKLLTIWKRARAASTAAPTTPRSNASSSSSAALTVTPCVTSSSSIPTWGSQTSSSSAKHAPVVTSSSSTTGAASSTTSTAAVTGGTPMFQQGGLPWARPPGAHLECLQVTGKPTRVMVRQAMQLLDALPPARCLEALKLGDLDGSSVDEDLQPAYKPFMYPTPTRSKQRSMHPGGSWRDSCKALFVGRLGYWLEMDDLALLLGQLPQLRDLYAFRVNLFTLPQHVESLQPVTRLDLGKPRGLSKEGVVEALAGLTNLRNLVVYDCTLARLPAAFPALGHLQSLHLANTDVCKEVVEAVCGISGLEVLELSRAPHLTSLPDSISRLTGMSSLALWETQVMRLPDSITAISSMQELAWGGPPAAEASNWLQLHTVWRLTGLHTLALSDALATFLPAAISQLTGLSALMVDGESLAILPRSLSRLVGLERLAITAGRVKALPVGVTALTRLTELVLNCPQLQPLEPAVQAFVEQRRKEQDSGSDSAPPGTCCCVQ